MRAAGGKQPSVSYSFPHNMSAALLQSNIPGYEGLIIPDVKSHYLLGKTGIK